MVPLGSNEICCLGVFKNIQQYNEHPFEEPPCVCLLYNSSILGWSVVVVVGGGGGGGGGVVVAAASLSFDISKSKLGVRSQETTRTL